MLASLVSCPLFLKLTPAAARRDRPAQLSRTLKSLAILAPLTLVLAAPAALHSQASFAGVALPAVPSGLSTPTGVAVDIAGNLYVADQGTGNVYLETPTSTGYVQSTIASGFQSLTSIAVDRSGNVYIGDAGAYRIVKATPSGGTYTQSVVDGAIHASGIAVDSHGNLFVSVYTTVVEETYSGGTYTPTTIAAHLNSTAGLAVDDNDNVYLADPNDGRVLILINLGDGFYFVDTLIGGFPAASPQDIKIDPVGNLYIADTIHDQVLLEVPDNSGTFTPQVLAVTGLVSPTYLALDGNGNLFVDDPVSQQIVELESASVNLGTVAAGTLSGPVLLPFTFQAGTTLGSINVLTTGITGKDFTSLSSTNACTPQTFSTTTTCTVAVGFNPHAPGPRSGAVVLADGSGNTLASVPVYGIGNSPLSVFAPAATTLIGGSSMPTPLGIATDASGNAYIAVTQCQCVVKTNPVGAILSQINGFSSPRGVGLDGAGNLYVVNDGDAIYQITPAGVKTKVSPGIHSPLSLALDGAGHLDTSDKTTNSIYKIAPSGAQVLLTTLSSAPDGLAVDGEGNVYATQLGNGLITMTTPAGVTTTIASGINGPTGIAIDPAGNLYYAVFNDNTIVQQTPSGAPTIWPAPSQPYGLALDFGGNLFYSSSANSNVYRFGRSVPPVFAFATTNGGATSTDSPQVATVQNIGNQPLAISAINYSVDFPESGSPSTDCTVGSLATSATCTFTVKFSPTSVAGSATTVPLTERVAVTDNTLNAAGTVQRIVTTGTELKTASAVSISTPSMTPTIGSGYAITAVVTGVHATGTVSFSSGGVVIGTAPVVAGKAVYHPSLAAGLHTVTATYSGDATFAASVSSSLSITVVKDSTTVTLTAAPNPNSASGSPSVTFTALMAETTPNVLPTGTVKFYSGGALIGTVDVASRKGIFTTSALTLGTHTITATYSGDGNYLTATSAALKQVTTR
jgi:sugar lactone lactonase YvrE